MSMNLVLMGLPGAGKGPRLNTLSKILTFHISQPGYFPGCNENETPMGLQAKQFIDKGELVPDEVTNGIVQERLAQDDVKDGFMLDGFPTQPGPSRSFERYA